MNFSVTFVLMVAASLAGTAYGAPSFHDFLDDDDVEANQQLLGEFGNNEFDDQPLGTLGDSEVVGQGLAVSRITRRSLGTLGDQNEPANPPKVSLGTLGDSEDAHRPREPLETVGEVQDDVEDPPTKILGTVGDDVEK